SRDARLIAAATCSPSRSSLLDQGGRWNVAVWDRHTRRVVSFSARGHARIGCLAFSADGRMLAGGTSEAVPPFAPGEVKLWDLTTGQETILRGHTSSISCLAFSPDGKVLA